MTGKTRLRLITSDSLFDIVLVWTIALSRSMDIDFSKSGVILVMAESINIKGVIQLPNEIEINITFNMFEGISS